MAKLSLGKTARCAIVSVSAKNALAISRLLKPCAAFKFKKIG